MSQITNKMKKKNPEEILQKQVVQYLKLQYPNIVFNSDMAGIKLTPGQATKASKLRSSNGFPDLAIYEARKGLNGLFLELKAEGKSPFKLNGKVKKDKHLQEQEKMLYDLNSRGYYAKFAVGFDEAKIIIDTYLN